MATKIVGTESEMSAFTLWLITGGMRDWTEGMLDNEGKLSRSMMAWIVVYRMASFVFLSKEQMSSVDN